LSPERVHALAVEVKTKKRGELAGENPGFLPLSDT